MTSEVAGLSRFEGTAFPDDLTDLFLEFGPESRGQNHAVQESY